MSASAYAGPAIVSDPAPETMALAVRGRHAGAVAGDPVESVRVLHDDGRGKTGVWECTPGRFESAREGNTEVMHFVAGEATITTADGTAHEIRPGTVIVAPDGWRGVWDVRETVRKVYVIWQS